MYPTSSQRRYWTFANEREIAELRLKHNQNFVLNHGESLGIGVCIDTLTLFSKISATTDFLRRFSGEPELSVLFNS